MAGSCLINSPEEYLSCFIPKLRWAFAVSASHAVNTATCMSGRIFQWSTFSFSNHFFLTWINSYLCSAFALQAVEFGRLVGSLRPEESEDVIVSACQRLIAIFHLHPDQKLMFVSQRGLLSLIELLEVPRNRVCYLNFLPNLWLSNSS